MRSKKELDAVFVVYDTEQEKLWNSNGKKIGWCSTGAAKNAWNLGNKIKFDQQERYVIVEINKVLVKSLIEEKNNDNE